MSCRPSGGVEDREYLKDLRFVVLASARRVE